MLPDPGATSEKNSRKRRACARPRLLPATMLCIGFTIIMKSAGLIDAALAQHPANKALLPLSGASHASGNVGTKVPQNAVAARSKKSYRPVSNWNDRPPPPPLCKPNPLDEAGETKILLALKVRAAALDAKSATLDREQQELDATKTALRKQVAALRPVAQRLEVIHEAQQSVDNARWAALVATYGAMDPHNAARIFDGLDPAIVFNVLKRMNDRKSALVLADMDPAKAQAVTERLADIKVQASQVVSAATLLPDGAP